MLDKIVIKPWGYEYVAEQCDEFSVRMLHIRSGYSTSYHYHDNKNTALLLLSGRVSIVTGENVITLKPGLSTYIKKRERHATRALDDSWVVEIESPPDHEDLIRVSDQYGRTGKPYENGDKIINFEVRFGFPAPFAVWDGR